MTTTISVVGLNWIVFMLTVAWVATTYIKYGGKK